jgi:hypothetical protein
MWLLALTVSGLGTIFAYRHLRYDTILSGAYHSGNNVTATNICPLDTNVHASLPITLAQATMTVESPEDRLGILDEAGWTSFSNNSDGFARLENGSMWAVSMVSRSKGTVVMLTGNLTANIQYHQLHCLNSIRRRFVGHDEHTFTSRDNAHVEHCLSYLYQMILCAADTALEPSYPAITNDGLETRISYAEGVEHTCRDWKQLGEWMNANFEARKEKVNIAKHVPADVSM